VGLSVVRNAADIYRKGPLPLQTGLPRHPARCCWFVDTAFTVHPDFKSHTSGAMTLGRGCTLNGSRKQKLNTRSSTEAKLVGADDMSQLIFWAKLFMEARGYEIQHNILYQDNKSTILLLENGKSSSSKRTCALNIRYFYLTDQIEKGNIEVHYCPMDKMVADYNSNPLQGKPFNFLRRMLLGHDIIPFPSSAADCVRQECVGQSDPSIQSQSHIEPHSRERSLSAHRQRDVHTAE